MKTLPLFSRRARWAVPAGVVALVAAVTTGSMVTVAAASPALPQRSAAELLTALAQAGPPPPLAGTVTETADLGVPALPGEQNPTSVLSLLSGSHTIQLWYGGPRQARLALPFPLGETDVIRNGTAAWIWQSSTDSVRHILLPARPAGQPGTDVSPSPAVTPLTPRQAVQRILAAVGPTTSVRTGPTTTVAGEDAYQLVIAPRDSHSLVGSVVIAVDAQHLDVPLRFQIFARGAASPAFETGYTQISFGPQPASLFDFTPPSGASVHTVTPSIPPAQAGSPPPAAGQRVIGTGWLSVAVLPASALSGLTGSGSAAGALGQAARSASGGPGGGGGPGAGAVLAALLKSATPVSGSWGSGKLLRTSLVSVLITSSHVLAGAVDPSVLYRAAATAG
jgi:outer membrane lipoprotein-sorting protein